MNLSIITYKGSNNNIQFQKYFEKNSIFLIFFRNFATRNVKRLIGY
jgi:hypothetical protein